MFRCINCSIPLEDGDSENKICIRCMNEEKAYKLDELNKWMDEEIVKIENDERYKYPPAQLDINGYLAIIQIEMKSRIRLLQEVKGRINK